MPLSLKIISSPDGEAIAEWNKNFPETGGSIGRSYGTTMQLSDASVSLSGTHAVINRSSRGYQIMDVSTNGLFINGSHQPLGKNNSAALNDGDVLNLGPYRLMVSCFVPDQASAKASPLERPSSLGEWQHDPFASESSTSHKQSEAVQETREASADLSFSAVDDSVEADPFSDFEAEAPLQMDTVQVNNFNDDYFDDDPFASEDSETSAVEPPAVEPLSSIQPPLLQREISPSDLLGSEQAGVMPANQQDIMLQAAEMAFARVMEEMAPSNIEDMFNDLTRPGFFSRKPDYWNMYKRYFQRQQGTQDWQLKFKAYFSESLRIKQLRGEK